VWVPSLEVSNNVKVETKKKSIDGDGEILFLNDINQLWDKVEEEKEEEDYIPTKDTIPSYQIESNINCLLNYHPETNSNSNTSLDTNTTTEDDSEPSEWDKLHKLLDNTSNYINKVDKLFQHCDLTFQPLSKFNYSSTADSKGNGGEGGGEGGRGGRAGGGDTIDVTTSDEGELLDNRIKEFWGDEIVEPHEIIYTTPSKYEINNLRRLYNDIDQNPNLKWKRMEGINRRRIYNKINTKNFIISPPHQGVSVIHITQNHLTWDHNQVIQLLESKLGKITKTRPTIFLPESVFI